MLQSVDESHSPAKVRQAVRRGYSGYTAGMAPGFVQANIAILPESFAGEFLTYCLRNKSACPLISVSEAGDPLLADLGEQIDIRTDVPRYHVFRDGVFVNEVTDISALWREDLVTVALGCSFSFEEALLNAGLPLPFLERGLVAGVYETNIDTVPAGRFGGKLIVSMRSFNAKDAIRAIQITSSFPAVHGAPVHIGDPEPIGVNLARRYQNVGSGHVAPGELPLFWACGLTPQLAIARAKPPISITHAPSSMLVTDLRNADLSLL